MDTTNGGLNFSSGINTDQLEKDAERIKQQLKGIGQSAESETAKMDSAFRNIGAGLSDSTQMPNKMKAAIQDLSSTTKTATEAMAGSFKGFTDQSSESIKIAIEAQKRLIKEIKDDIDSLQRQSAGATGKNKLSIVGDIQGAKKALAEEQGTLIGMQKQQVITNKQEENSQTGIINSLSKWAVGLFTVTAAMKIGKAIIASTEATAHLFEQAVEASTSGIGYFFKAIASGDWSNFFSGMEKAIKGATDFVDTMEIIENRRNEQLVKSSKFDIEIGKNRADSYSTDSKLVKKALTNIIALQTEKLTEEAKLAKDEYNVKLKKIATDNGLTEKEVEAIATNYSKISAQIEKGERYRELQRTRFNVGAGTKEFKDQNAEFEAMGKSGEEAAKIAEKYAKVPMADRAAIANSLKTANEAEAAININNRRDKQRLVGLQKADDDKAAADAKKALEERNRLSKNQLDYETEIGRQRIQNQLDIDQQNLNNQKDGVEKSRKQADLDFQKTIVDIANKKAEQLKKLNEVNGGIDEKTGKQTVKYIAVLPEADQAQITEKILLAEQTRSAKIVEINEKESEKLKQIWNEINDTRLTGIEKARASINEKYDKMAKDAEGHADILAAIEHERVKATTAFNIKAATEDASFQEQVAIQQETLKSTGFDSEDKLLNKLFEIHVMYQQIIIDRLKSSPDIKDQQQATLLQGDLDIDKKNHALGEQSKTWGIILNTTGQLIDGIRQYNSGLADAMESAMKLGVTLQDAFQKGGSKMSKQDAYAQAASGIISLIELAANASKKRKEQEDAYYASVIKQQRDYNLLLNEELRINSQVHGNVFFTNYEGKIKDATTALNDANKKYNEELKKFADAEAITGQKNVVDGNAVLKGVGAGAAAGAAIGSIIPGLGTAVGAVVGAAVGAIVGLFSKKKKDILAPLLATYPDLIKANGDFNDELAKTLIANNQVTDATKATLQNLIDWKAAAELAREQLVSVIRDIAGTMGDDIRNGLVKAFEDGTTAAKAFGDAVDKVLENMLSNMIFNTAFGPLLDKLQTDMFASYGLGPDGKTPLEGNPMKPNGTAVIDNNWADDLLTFFKGAGPAMDMMNKGLVEAKKWGKENGLDLFTGSSGSSTSQSAASTGLMQSMSQDTGNALEGRFTALQMIGSDTLSLFKSIVPDIQAIRLNTNALSVNGTVITPVIRVINDSPDISAIRASSQISADSLKEQRNIALESMNHLADINKNTKQLYDTNDKLDKIIKNTSGL